MQEWTAEFPLEPVPYGRSRIAMIGGKPRPFTPAATRKSMSDLKLFIANANPVLFEGPIGVSLTFVFVRPKSVSEKKRPLPSVKPDIDNVCKSVFDSGTGLLWRDDSQVVYLQAFKQYGDRPSIGIKVWGLSR